jgi:ubiquinone/menaquinone biosynthesis C-methylase UbiE
MVKQVLKPDLSVMSELNAAAYETAAALAEYDKPGELTPIEEILFDEFFNPDERLLDIGCGAGRTSYRLMEDGFEVVGVDLSETLLEAARTRCPGAEFRHADVRDLPLEDQSFSQALFSFNGMDQVHPIGDYLKALKEIGRVLRPNGILIYSGHNIIGRFGRHLRTLREFASVTLRVHPRFLSVQFRGSQISKWYWRYPEPFGEVVSFSAPPYVHKRLQARAGFETLAVRGQDNEKSERWLTFREHHIHYVVRKR